MTTRTTTSSNDSIRLLPPQRTKARKLALAALALAPFLVGLLALYLGQDTNWDFRNYHWYNAYAFLNGRYGFDLLPSQMPYFYNPALDVPYFLLASHTPVMFANFVLSSVQGLNFVLLFMLAHAALIIPNARQKVWVCALLALLGLMGGGSIAQIGTTFYDNITSLGLFLSALLVLKNFKRLMNAKAGSALVLALLCGLPAGLMMGFKLPAVVFCAGLCGAILFVTGPLTRRVWIAFGFGLGITLGAALTMGPWAYFLYSHYGSPLFPYYNNVFNSPLLPPINLQDIQFRPYGLHDRAFFPFIFAKYPHRVGEVPWRDLRIPILYVALPLCAMIALAFGRNKNAPDRAAVFFASRYLLWAAALSYAAWLFLFAIYRYLIPLEMLAPLLIVLALGLLPIKPPMRALLTAFMLVLIAATLQPGDWGRRGLWMDKAVEISGPSLANLKNEKNLMILMAGYSPYSHVVPEFPPEIPFVRIQSNFTAPDNGYAFNDLIKARVLSHSGSYKLLIPDYDKSRASDALRHLNLAFLPQSCQPVLDHLNYDSQLQLCDVKHTTPSVKP